jgi:hypothetical protein
LYSVGACFPQVPTLTIIGLDTGPVRPTTLTNPPPSLVLHRNSSHQLVYLLFGPRIDSRCSVRALAAMLQGTVPSAQDCLDGTEVTTVSPKKMVSTLRTAGAQVHMICPCLPLYHVHRRQKRPAMMLSRRYSQDPLQPTLNLDSLLGRRLLLPKT